MNKYKVRVRGGVAWQGEDRCYMGISIGQPSQQGEKFLATVDWINRHFKSLHIVLADTLYRHNFMFEFCESLEDATTRSRLAGDRWLSENAEALQLLRIEWSLSRWRQWVDDQRYRAWRIKIGKLYEDHSEVRTSVRDDAERYINNAEKRGVAVLDREFAIKQCIEYILEENAMFPLIIADHGTLDVYPGSELASTTVIRSLPIPDAPRGIFERRPARLELERRPSWKAANDDEPHLATAKLQGAE